MLHCSILHKSAALMLRYTAACALSAVTRRHVCYTFVLRSGARSHGGVSHAHSHRPHGAAADGIAPHTSTSPELRRAATTVIHVGMLSDLVLAVAKGGVGAWSGSSALISDAVHSASDVLVSGVAWLGTSVSRAPPDSSHPYGHGRFDTLGALAVGGVLCATSAALGMHGVEQAARALSGLPLQPLLDFRETPALDAAASVSDAAADVAGQLASAGAAPMLTDSYAAAAAIGVSLAAVALKEAIYRWNMRVRSQMCLYSAL